MSDVDNSWNDTTTVMWNVKWHKYWNDYSIAQPWRQLKYLGLCHVAGTEIDFQDAGFTMGWPSNIVGTFVCLFLYLSLFPPLSFLSEIETFTIVLYVNNCIFSFYTSTYPAYSSQPHIFMCTLIVAHMVTSTVAQIKPLLEMPTSHIVLIWTPDAPLVI